MKVIVQAVLDINESDWAMAVLDINESDLDSMKGLVKRF